MKQDIVLETPRLIFGKICIDDYQGISKILQDIEVMYAWGHTFSDQEVTEWINENIMICSPYRRQ